MTGFKLKGYHVVMCILAVIIAYITACSFFHSYESNKYHYSVIVLGLVVIFGEITFIILFKKILDCSNKILNLLAVISLVILFGIQIWIVWDLKPIVLSDLANVYAEAVNMLKKNGEITNTGYFSSYSHQIPFLLVLYQLFRIGSFLGIKDFAVLGGIFNGLLITLSVFVGYLILCKLKGKNIAIFFLLTCIFNPALYFYVPYFYSDTICIPFIMLIIYFIVLIKEKEDKSLIKYFLYFLLGLTVGWGLKLRATVFIIGFAVIIYLFLKENFKEFLKYTIIIVFGMIVAISSYKVYQKQYVHFDTEAKMFPWTHYVMMGVKGEGRWNEEDWSYTQSLGTKEEKTAGNIKEIKKRVVQLGPGGIFHLVKNKIRLTWSSGTHAFKMYIKGLNNDSLVLKYMVEHNRVFIYWCQSFQCLMMVLLLTGLFYQILKKQIDIFSIMFLSIFGAVLFYIFWEVRPRYSVFLILIMHILMILGQEVVYKIKGQEQINCKIPIAKSKKVLRVPKTVRKKVVILGVFGIVFSVILIGINFTKYTKTKKLVYNYCVKQKMVKSPLIRSIKKGDTFIQTFNASKDFRYIEIKFVNKNKNVNAQYKVELLKNNGDLLSENIISAADLDESGYAKMKFKTVKPKKEEKYKIIICSYNATKKNSLGLGGCSFGEGYHIVKGGQALLNGKELKGDLAFKVYDKLAKPYFTKLGYILLSIILIGAEVIILNLYIRKG
ncbi:glycosyltransferase family 39 protein [Anaerosacchariphilus polymeriproducens]|uniref:Glycosyltransferase RgtA/B/C/D-like domain-containing protein n=1 Tax=Anaerosacchariphilus polymeriproducens TaxID=1812858 RepID=A0A371ARK4_9FIRM|nr:glycosyltransferase family 39 protein [Anaerosacchariphilus polymeriproducens]RDU22100.1 hypothetical protein DWV06_16355 [Anaerosacchariphilus polymeriproducens]